MNDMATKADLAEFKKSVLRIVVPAVFLATLLPELLNRFGI